MGEAQPDPAKTFEAKVIVLKKNQFTKSIVILLKTRETMLITPNAFYRMNIRNRSLEVGYENRLKSRNDSKNIGLVIQSLPLVPKSTNTEFKWQRNYIKDLEEVIN